MFLWTSSLLASPCISSTKLVAVELNGLQKLWRSWCFLLMLRCLSVCSVSCWILFVIAVFFAAVLHLLTFETWLNGYESESCYLFVFWFASFWLHSTAVSDQTQVVCVHQASVFGGGAGSHTSSTSPSGISSPRHQPVSFCTGSACWQVGFFEQISIRIRKSFIAKCVCTHKEFVLVLGASSTESTNIVQTTYN